MIWNSPKDAETGTSNTFHNQIHMKLKLLHVLSIKNGMDSKLKNKNSNETKQKKEHLNNDDDDDYDDGEKIVSRIR